MRRRAESGRKSQRWGRSKARKAPTTQVSTTDFQEEVAALRRELKEAREQQTATSEVLQVISRSPGELDRVFKAMLENATRICNATYGVMFLREGKGFRTAATHNLPRAFAEERQQAAFFEPIPIDPLARLAKTKQKVHISDARTEAAYKKGFAPFVAAVELGGVRTLLSTPLLREGELIGAFVIYRQEVRPFTGRQIELVKNFAAQAVIAIENTRLLNELRQRTDNLSEALEQQTATSEVLKVISSSPGELEPVFQAMLANATRICEATFGNLFLREGTALRAVAVHGKKTYADSWQRDPVIDLRDNPGVPLDRLFNTKQVTHVPDLRVEESYIKKNVRMTNLVDVAGARTYLAVPMLKEGNLIGAIGLYRDEMRPFTDKQVELVQNFAAQAVIAIENTRLLNELRRRTDDLTASLEQQTATSDVLKIISSSPGDLQPVFQTILENATRICAARFGTLNLYDGNAYKSVALHNPPPQFATRKGEVIHPHPESGLAYVARTKKIAHIDDIRTRRPYLEGDKAVVAIADQAGARTLLIVPMLKDDELIGSISIYRQEVLLFNDKQIELLRNFAAQAVIAIENTRLLNELRESLQQQTATSEVLGVISSSPTDVQPVFDTIANNAVNLCGATYCIAYNFDGEMIRMLAHHNLDEAQFDALNQLWPMRPDSRSVVGRTILGRDVLHVEDVAADPNYVFANARPVLGIRSYLGVPMMREGQPIGAIALYRRDVKPFSDRQIELVKSFADQAVIAIENVRLFERVETRTRELAKSLEELRTTQDRLVQTQKLALLGQLTAGIAHEIKNPLNFVNNFSGISAELIDELQNSLKSVSLDEKTRTEIDELADTLKSNFDKVVHHGRRADAIVKNMLQHSREGSGEHRVIDINALVEESLNLAWHGARAETKGFEIKLKQSFDPSAGGVDVFPQDIRRALLNLIANGFYAATKRRAEINGSDYEPTLTASTRNLGDQVEIRIRDNGTGIAADVKEKMFEPFFTTKPTGEGTGLGLSISHDIIVKQHAGLIEVDTKPGEFTEIRVILPRVAALLPDRA